MQARHLTHQPSSTMHDIIWNEVGSGARQFISDDRIALMLKMTRGDVRDTVIMAFGYIIQHLELEARNNKNRAAAFRSEMALYRQKLQTYM